MTADIKRKLVRVLGMLHTFNARYFLLDGNYISTVLMMKIEKKSLRQKMCSQKNVAKNMKKSSASEDVNRRRMLDKSYPSPNKSRDMDWVCVLLLWSYIYVLYILHMVYSCLNYVHKYIHGLN